MTIILMIKQRFLPCLVVHLHYVLISTKDRSIFIIPTEKPENQ